MRRSIIKERKSRLPARPIWIMDCGFWIMLRDRLSACERLVNYYYYYYYYYYERKITSNAWQQWVVSKIHNVLCYPWTWQEEIVFSRSYCYTVWSAIGIIVSSVCLSVCDAGHCGCQVWCTGLKVVGLRVPGRHVPICPSDTFAVWCIA